MKSPFPFLKLGGLVVLSFLILGAELKPGELNRNEAIFYRSEGQRLQKIDDLQGAQIAYQKALLLNPGYAQAYNDLGVILESRGDVDGAESFYRQALQVDPALGAAHSNLALLYERLGRLEEAGRHWDQRVKLGPPDDPWVIAAREKLAKYNLAFETRQAFESANLHMKAKRGEAAKGLQEAQRQWQQDSLRAAPPLRTKPPEKRPKQLNVQEEKKIQEKQRTAQQGMQAKKRKMEADRAYEAGKIYLKSKRWEDAQREFDRALALDPTHEGAVTGLMDAEAARLKSLSVSVKEVETPAAVSSRTKEEAMKAALRSAGVVNQQPVQMPRPSVVKAPVVLQAQEEKKEEAAPVAKEAAPPVSREAQAIAQEWIRQKTRTRQDTVRQLYQRGITAMRQARYDDAVTSFQQILTLEPNQPDAQQGLKRAHTALAKSKKS